MLQIILVDDEPHNVFAMEEILNGDKDFKILANCFNGMSALQAVEALNPDLLIADVLMPGLSGIELARRVREVKPDLPIILMSDQAVYAVDSYDIGISGFLTKPLESGKVHKTLGRILD